MKRPAFHADLADSNIDSAKSTDAIELGILNSESESRGSSTRSIITP